MLVGKTQFSCWLLLYGLLVMAGMVSMSYVFVWVVLEVTMMMSMVYVLWEESRVGAIFYYYVVQAVGSLMMIVGAMVEVGVVLWSGFIVKMGLFPVFVWMVAVVWGLGGVLSVMLVLWAQKLLPLILVYEWGWLVIWSSSLLVMLVFMGVVLASLGMLMGHSVKWLLTMSSVVHTSWLVVIMMMAEGSMLFYFGMYGCMMLVVLVVVLRGGEQGGAGSLAVLSSIPPLVGFGVKFYSFSLVVMGLEVVIVGGVVLVVATIIGYLLGLIGEFMVSKSSAAEEVGMGSVGALLFSLLFTIVL
uniref:NADH dehydrogenase subunit 2 n=1 Tax=Centrorhynchus clitorideus TaxID=2731796 RepID=A0A6M3YZ90_9BILA|nr:NADH dehydrogenase subunit 2 [Centrorhynchus clitorideus]